MTAQFTNSIRIDGNGFSLADNPLAPLLEEKGITIEGYCTACWDGYLSDWDITDNKLYLVDVVPCFTDEEGEKIMTMDYLFPGQDKVFANWYTGELLIQEGDLLNYVHMGYASTYEKHIHIKIKTGVIIETRIEDNRGKTFPTDEKNDMFHLFA